MSDRIEPMHISISLKNIGIPSEFEYQKMFIHRIEDFIKRLRWYCFHIGPPYFNKVLFNNHNPNTLSQNSQVNNTQSQTNLESQNS